MVQWLGNLKMKIWIFVLLIVHSSCEETSKYPENPTDISSINNLAYKPPISLDPKIRKALLNVLNRLELQENYKPEAELSAIQTTRSSITNETVDNIKWEYKANDTFKEYNYYEVSADDSTKSSDLSTNDEKTIDEPGALFFQIPETREPLAEKHESLHLQESKNALSNADLLVSDFEDEKHPSEPPRTVQNVTENRNEINEKDVEVFQAPLLTAFTLEQDERGLPRRIIPLEPSELRSILDNKVIAEPDVRRAREQTPVYRNPVDASPLLLEEQKRFRIELESQFRELQERKREIELERERLFAEQEKARRLKYDLEQRQKEQEYFRSLNQNEIHKNEIAFQKSIEPQFAFHSTDMQPVVFHPFSVPIARSIPQSYPDAVDRHLQNLFHRSGLGKQEDLNIVSKILALNHDGEEERAKQVRFGKGDDSKFATIGKRIILRRKKST